jgi:hypothetical protein
VTDPRAGDVAHAEQLLAQAADDGIAKLPVLSAAELWVLCGDRQVLADEAEQRWWTSMTDADREKYSAKMVSFLIERELIRAPENGGATLPMTPELGLVVAARQFPAVVAVCTLASGSADKSPRLYGLANGDQPPRVLVAEITFPASQAAFGPMHHFSLLSPERAGRLLADWAIAQAKGGLLGRKSRSGPRTIDLYRNRPGEQLTRDRVTVALGDADSFQVARQGPDGKAGPASLTRRDELTAQLTAMLAGAPV